jgi:hypothetical protein
MSPLGPCFLSKPSEWNRGRCFIAAGWMGTARLLVIGQDPAQREVIARAHSSVRHRTQCDDRETLPASPGQLRIGSRTSAPVVKAAKFGLLSGEIAPSRLTEPTVFVVQDSGDANVAKFKTATRLNLDRVGDIQRLLASRS